MSSTNFDQNGQNVNTQTNVGRDQIIHNLVLVGQFLDFTRIEGLIPKITEPRNFDEIIDGLDKSINERMNSDLAEAAVFAGEILKPLIIKFKPKSRFEILSTEKIMEELPIIIGVPLIKLGYWASFGTGDFFVLESTNQVLNKYTKKQTDVKLYRVNSAFIQFKNVASPISQDDFRVLMVGIVIDLMRLYTKGSIGIKFWAELTNILSANPQ